MVTQLARFVGFSDLGSCPLNTPTHMFAQMYYFTILLLCRYQLPLAVNGYIYIYDKNGRISINNIILSLWATLLAPHNHIGDNSIANNCQYENIHREIQVHPKFINSLV